MNRKEQLLHETLGENPGEQFARLAAARVRRQRVVRQAGATAGAACLLAAGFMFRPQSPAPHTEATVAAQAPALEIISDEELITQLKDQSVLFLTNDNRITGVVFLDAGTKL